MSTLQGLILNQMKITPEGLNFFPALESASPIFDHLLLKTAAFTYYTAGSVEIIAEIWLAFQGQVG